MPMPPYARPLVLLLVVAPGCATGIRAQYEATRVEALADPGPAPADWTPDAVLGLGWPLAEALLAREVDARLDRAGSGIRIDLPLGGEASASPALALEDLSLSPGRGCEACARLDATVGGHVRWSAGPTSVTTPVHIALAATVDLAVTSTGRGHAVDAVVRRFQVRDADAEHARGVDLGAPLVAWVLDRLGGQPPTVPLATLGADAVPARAFRLVPEAGGLRVDLLTQAPSPDGARPAVPAGRPDWYLSVRTASLLGLARRAAFEEGDLGYGVHADPRALAVDGDRFTLGLRLWRLEGAGWWRDYAVEGGLRLEGNRIRLEPSDVAEGEHSAGAGVLDPLTLLARGAILEAIADGLRIARPASEDADLGASRLHLEASEAAGRGGSLVLVGEARIEGRKGARGRKE